MRLVEDQRKLIVCTKILQGSSFKNIVTVVFAKVKINVYPLEMIKKIISQNVVGKLFLMHYLN